MTDNGTAARSCLPADLLPPPSQDASRILACMSAAERGDPAAQCALGLCYACGDHVERDYRKAVFWFRKAARKGHDEAQFNLGIAYENGYGVPKNFARAFAWYMKAAEQGKLEAQSCVGRYLLAGLGVEAHLAKAIRWLTRPARAGDATAQFLLWIALSKAGRGERRMTWLRRAAGQGHARAQLHLARSFEAGRGVGRSLSTAVVWYRKAADQGEAQALFGLAAIHDDPLGHFHEPEKAEALYLDAARRGSAAACLKLGCKALGEQDDEVDAFRWFTLALRFARASEHQIAWRATENLRTLTSGMDASLIEEGERRIVEWIRH